VDSINAQLNTSFASLSLLLNFRIEESISSCKIEPSEIFKVGLFPSGYIIIFTAASYCLFIRRSLKVMGDGKWNLSTGECTACP